MIRPEVDKTRVRRHFSQHAEDYDRYAVVQKRVVDRLLERLRTANDFNGPVLEVGTGTGSLGRQFSVFHPHHFLVVSDLAHGMTLHAAQVMADAVALDADARNLPFRSQAFGLIISSSMYQWVNDLPGAFAESFRVLISGGRFALALFGERTLFELRNSHRRAIAEGNVHGTSHVQEFPSIVEVRDALQFAGFTDIYIEQIDEIEYHADVPTLLRNLKKIGAQNANRSGPTGFVSRQVMQRMMKIYRNEYGNGESIPATYQVIYAIATTG